MLKLLRMRGLQKRYTLILAALILGVVLVLAVTLLIYFRSALAGASTASAEAFSGAVRTQIGNNGLNLTRLLASNLINPLYQYDMASIDRQLRNVRQQPDVLYTYLFDNNGKIVHDGLAEIPGFGRMMEGSLAAAAVTAREPLLQENREILDVTVPLYINSRWLGGVRVGYSLAPLKIGLSSLREEARRIGDSHLRNQLIVILLITVALLLTGIGTAAVVTRRLIRPIRQLADAATRIGNGQEGGPLDSHRNDELGELALSFTRMEENLSRTTISRDYLDRIIGSMNDALFVCDNEGIITMVNRATCQMLGYTEEALHGRPIDTLLENEGSLHAQQLGVQGGEPVGELQRSLRHRNGERVPVSLSISPLQGSGDERSMVYVAKDITEQREHQRQLEHIAHYDALTGLPNRVLLADRLSQAMVQVQRRGLRLAVAYLDLDDFKSANDDHGHVVGDHLLMTLANSMKGALREGDTIARLGGDEFVAVIMDLDDSEASLETLNRLLDAAARPVNLDELELQVSASLGVTFYPQAEEVDADQLLRQADQAMYQAKLAGKNRFHLFDAEQDRSVRSHHESLEHIRHALIEEQFVLFYQPKVNMRSGEIIGAEALIRWQHPEQGLLSPAQFLPIIEEHPLAVELGEWVIDSALTQLERWHATGLNISVSVNVGARQLQQENFMERLQSLLAAHPEVNPGFLELEVLETSALEDFARISLVMHDCQQMGVRFALDDFGTGYSSLTYLKRLPATQLKIDQSFVRDMLDDPEDLAILDGVLGLAAAFYRQAIAEGVESIEHGQLLLQLGCELGQGYAIARPMPAERLPDWVASWQPDPKWKGRQPVSRGDLPLLFAGVEHRAWVRALDEWLKGERKTPPERDRHQCRFGHWLYGEGQARHGEKLAFEKVKSLHGQAHLLAEELLKTWTRDKNTKLLSGLSELHRIRDKLLEQLQVVLHKG